MYDLRQFASDIEQMKRHFPAISVEQFVWAAQMGISEQCKAWGESEKTISQVQALALKTLSPVASYLFACEQISEEELLEAERICQQSLSDLSQEDHQMFGGFGGGCASIKCQEIQQNNTARSLVRM